MSFSATMLGPSDGRPVRVGMGLDEHPRDTHRHGGPGQHGDEFPLAAGTRPLPARLLHGMGRVEHHRCALVTWAMIGRLRMSETRVL